MDFFFVLGMGISLFLIGLGSYMEKRNLRKPPPVDFQVIRRSSPTRPGEKKSRHASARLLPAANFQAQRIEGQICWKTGMRRDSCPCESCKK